MRCLVLFALLLVLGCVHEESSCVSSDACSFFSCEVPGCWCKEGESVLFESDRSILSESSAFSLAVDYLGLSEGVEVFRISDHFYNVLVDNEFVFTVSSSGVIFSSECGV